MEPATEAEAIRSCGIKDRFEKFHSVQYTEDALTAAVVYSNRYVKDRYLPDKAIDLIDDAGAYVKMKLGESRLTRGGGRGKKRLKFISGGRKMPLTNHEFEKARFYWRRGTETARGPARSCSRNTTSRCARQYSHRGAY